MIRQDSASGLPPESAATRLRSLVRTVIRFGLVGISSVAIYFVLLALLRPLIPSVALLASAAYLGSMVFNFLAQSRFTFATRTLHGGAILRYLVMHATCAGVNSGGMHLLVNVFGFNLWLSQIAVTALVTVVSFLMSYFWVYKGARQHNGPVN